MKRMLLGLLGAGAISAVGICEMCTPAASAGVLNAEAAAVARETADTATVRLRVEGMTCGGCAISVRLVLEGLGGVEDARVDYDAKLALVRYDPKKVTPARMIAALKDKLKYTATVVEPTSGS